MSFGLRLRNLRLSNRLSQAKLAKKLDIPQTTLSDLENNKYEPDLSLAKKIAKYFNKTLDEMI